MENLNQLKLESQMEVAKQMMMQMDKLPFDFCGSSSGDDPNFPTSVFCGVSASTGSLSNLRDNSPVASPYLSSTGPVSTDNIPLLPIQEQTRQPHMYSDSSKRNRWKNHGDLSSINAFTTTIEKQNSMAAMREMMYRIAAMQPINIDPESVKPPKRRNVKISKDPQSIAARHRREKISEKIRILQRLVPGGTRMDIASMLDEAINYVKFLKTQVQSLERYAATRPITGVGFPLAMSSGGGMRIRPLYLPPEEAYQAPQNVQYQDYPES